MKTITAYQAKTGDIIRYRDNGHTHEAKVLTTCNAGTTVCFKLDVGGEIKHVVRGAANALILVI